MFTASNELSILNFAQKIGIEGLALGGKFIRDQSIIHDGIRSLYFDFNWTSPNIIEHLEIKNFARITILEFAVVSMLLLGKSTTQLSDEMDMTRKQINNAIYRVKEKLCLDTEISRQDFLEEIKEKILASFEPSQFYNLTEIISVNSFLETNLSPVLNELKAGGFTKNRLRDFRD